ncbi:MAG: ABC transporter permease [Acidobacteria bacterium]|nr:ABC transporter permease [Acidobacteriota bacterium]
MTTWLGTLRQDLRYGTRELLHNKSFTATAILSLALGILATSALYSVIYGVVLEPFPYKDTDSLTSIAIRNPEQRGWRSSYNIEEYVELSKRSTIFDGVAASTISDVLWVNSGEPLRLRGNHISHNGFDVMGVPALLGRAVTAADPNPETQAVLGYRFWVRQFGGNPSIIGTTLILNDRPRTIVGVMPPRFMFRGADVYLPLAYQPGQPNEGVSSVIITARRKPAITAAQAETDLDPIIRDLANRYPDRYPKRWRIELISFKETFPSGIRQILWIMFAAVGLLLLIACTNVSNLLLARASTRQREMAMRAALGASRGRLIRQLLTESVLLAIAGGITGIAGAWGGLKLILAIVPPGVIPDESEVVLNTPVLFFSALLCLATVIVFGFVPALHASRPDLATPLKEAGRSTGASRRMNWFRASLVVLELSLAVVLLSGAGLFLNTLLRLYNAPLAVGIDHRLTMRVPLSERVYPSPERRAAFIQQMLEGVSALPGVLAVGINTGLHPLGSWDFPVEVPSNPQADKRPVNIHMVNAGYLKLTGIALRQGRWLQEADIAARRRIAIVNETFVKRYFNGQPVMGRQVKLWRLGMPPFNLPDTMFEIGGVVQDALHQLHNGEARPELYFPYSILGMSQTLVVHTAGDPMAMAPHVKRVIYQLRPNQFVDETRTLESILDRYVYSQGRFRLWLMGAFGVLGLVLACIGVYGLLTQIVEMQQQEYGVRMALGAGSADLIRLVLSRGTRLLTIGLAVGLASTLILLWQFGVILGVSNPFDLPSLLGSCALLFAVGIVACWVPAMRAARTDPLRVLR